MYSPFVFLNALFAIHNGAEEKIDLFFAAHNGDCAIQNGLFATHDNVEEIVKVLLQPVMAIVKHEIHYSQFIMTLERK